MGEIQLPPDWKVVKLGDYCEKPEYGYTASATEQDSGYKFLRITDIQDGTVRWNSVPYCEVDKTKIDKYILLMGDIVVARIGATTGKSFLINDCPEAVFASYLIRIRTKRELLPSFLNFYFETETYWKQIDANKGGKLKGGVNIPIIKNLLVPLPPLPEQKTIAHTLRTIQKAKETRQQELELERERKAALMQYLFTHGTGNEPREETKVGEIPNSWKVIKFGQICESSAYGPRFSGNLYDPNGTIATLRTTDIDEDGNINYSTMPFASLEIPKFKNHLIEAKDLVITRSGTCGIAAVFESYNSPVIPGAFLIRFRLNEYAEPYFLRYYINSHIGRRRITQLASGAVQKNISGTSLLNWLIPLPTIPEQLKIVGILRTCDRKIQALEKEIALTDELFHAMLEQLMTGKISTQPLSETYV
ncbi:MAG: restriction endonuclease subunit S [Nostoc sp.]|uniref:restriction endonuclease subunit S n=1 Tax=Nostoc sp. TaxID=1180 RepID=UPI002FF674C7